ncbi:MAG: replicative DNA helicase [Parvularculaceae bacterium]
MADDGDFNLPAPKKGADADKDASPNSLAAEQAILGALLFDNEIYYRVFNFLKADHFFDPIHAMIYDACGALIGGGRVASPVTIEAYLGSSEGFRAAGGQSYLERLAASVPTTAGAHDYAKIVFDLATHRGLMEVGGEMIERARRPSLDDPPDAQLEDAEKALYALAETGKYGVGFKSMGSAVKDAITVATKAIERGGGLSGVATGLTDLDDMMGGLHSSDLIILAGRPSMGKTALATNIAVNAARAYKPEAAGERANEGAVVGFFSLEMSADQIAMRIISETAEVPSHEIRRGTINQSEFERIYDAARDLERLPLHIDVTGGLAIAQLAARARRQKRQQKGLGLLVVDYLQLLTGSSRKNDGNRVQEITEISVGLKALAKELNVPIIALSQLSRQVESREDKRPQLADLRESGSIEQDADVVLFVFREEYYLKRAEPKGDTDEARVGHARWLEQCEAARGIAEVIIGKQRHGPIGTVRLHFNENFTRFGNLDPGYHDDYRRD